MLWAMCSMSPLSKNTPCCTKRLLETMVSPATPSVGVYSQRASTITMGVRWGIRVRISFLSVIGKTIIKRPLRKHKNRRIYHSLALIAKQYRLF